MKEEFRASFSSIGKKGRNTIDTRTTCQGTETLVLPQPKTLNTGNYLWMRFGTNQGQDLNQKLLKPCLQSDHMHRSVSVEPPEGFSCVVFKQFFKSAGMLTSDNTLTLKTQ